MYECIMAQFSFIHCVVILSRHRNVGVHITAPVRQRMFLSVVEFVLGSVMRTYLLVDH